MKAVWKLDLNNKLTEITFIYNTLIGYKKIFVDDKCVVNRKVPKKEKFLEFNHDGLNLKIELIPEDFGYVPFLITDKGERFDALKEEKTFKDTPRWVWIFILINYSVPVISVEALTPWVVATLGSFFSVKIAQNTKLSFWMRILTCIVINLIVYGAYYMYYLKVKHLGFDGGFIPF